MAIGNFFADFFTASFMGLAPQPTAGVAVHALPGGGAVPFELALGG